LKKVLTATVAAALVAASSLAPNAVAQSPELIPRNLIFGNPSRLLPKLSPDGKSIAWLAPRDGVLNVWVAPADALDKAKPVTDERPRPIMEYWWSPDGTRIVYAQDRGGNENWVLYGVELATGKQTAYTDPEKVTVRVSARARRCRARSWSASTTACRSSTTSTGSTSRPASASWC
jgi:Tol biopolymer transport system component